MEIGSWVLEGVLRHVLRSRQIVAALITIAPAMHSGQRADRMCIKYGEGNVEQQPPGRIPVVRCLRCDAAIGLHLLDELPRQPRSSAFSRGTIADQSSADTIE